MSLKFGITPLDFVPTAERVIVNGVPDFSRFDIVDVIREAVDGGFPVVELTMDIVHIVPGSLSPGVVERLADLRDELHHSYTVHLPFWSLELASFNDDIRKASVASIVKAIEVVEPLNPESYVLHTTGALGAEFSSKGFPAHLHRLVCALLTGFSATSVEEIITATEINPRLLAIENLDFPFEFTQDVVEEYDTSICFDVGHLVSKQSGTESIIEFYRAHKNRIIEMHLHDGTYQEVDGFPHRTDHIALGEGEMPISDFFTELVRDKFDYPLIFETSTREAELSLERIRRLVPSAF
ncbi:MAG: cobamide remodeling phosphodiesterase CbiR [Candidatus Thorarchaeota archaeon]